MTDRTTIKALIEEAYEARRVEDVERIIAVFHPNAKLQIAGSKEIAAAAGTANGHEEIRRISTALIASFQFVERDILSFLIDGDRASVHSRVHLRFIPKNQIAITEIVDLWKIEEGKLVELVEFADTALVNDLMR